MLDIGLQSEYILSFFGLNITNTFLTSILVTVLLSLLGIIFYINQRNHKNIIINGLRILIFELLKLVDIVTEDRKLSKKILPLIATFFLFIVTANLLELLPGFLGSFFVNTPTGEYSILRSPNSDLTTTIALALFSVFAIQFFSLQALGIKKYTGRFINFKNPIMFILGFFEIISESVKVFSFSFRLFGNIFAGEVLLLVVAFLIPYIIPLPFLILEVFVGIVQAFIFTMLTLTFIKTSTIRYVGSKM
ncbi:MAG TPA: F0F1 ATP synthase subunit A [Candidatus Kaiserbacteria bacterium]|nr:F0F1 ATP synthase subunit A [Candidatus Kaiserbacteria bacterium]